MTAIVRSAAPETLAKQAPDPIPAFLLGRLAVDRRYAGAGIGTALVAHVLATAIELNVKAACRAIVVTAMSPAARTWWERLGFAPLDTGDPDGRDLYLLSRDVGRRYGRSAELLAFMTARRPAMTMTTPRMAAKLSRRRKDAKPSGPLDKKRMTMAAPQRAMMAGRICDRNMGPRIGPFPLALNRWRPEWTPCPASRSTRREDPNVGYAAASRPSSASSCAEISAGRSSPNFARNSFICGSCSRSASRSTSQHAARSSSDMSRPVGVDRARPSGTRPNGVSSRARPSPSQRLEDPLRARGCSRRSRATGSAPLRLLAEPVDVEDLRQLRAFASRRCQPVREVVGHVVAAERQHRERVEAQLADAARGRRRLSELIVAPRNTPCSQSSASVTSGTTVERRPPKSIASTGDALGVLPLRRDRRILRRRAS